MAISEENQGLFSPDFRFISLYTYRKRYVFIDEIANKILCDAISFHNSEKNVEIAGYSIVPDHIHLLVRPLKMSAPVFVTSFKSYTGLKIKEARSFSNKIWRRRFFDIPVTDEETFRQRLDLMHFSPVKNNFVSTPGEYPWTSWADYNGGAGLARIMAMKFSVPKEEFPKS